MIQLNSMDTNKDKQDFPEDQQKQEILQTGELFMKSIFGDEPQEAKGGRKRSEARQYWELFRKLGTAEPRYLNYIQQFNVLMQKRKEQKEEDTTVFIRAFQTLLSTTRRELEKELHGNATFDELNEEERTKLLTFFIKSPAVEKMLRRTHQHIGFRRDIKEYAKIVLEKLEASKEGLVDHLTTLLNKRALLQVEGPREIGRAIRQVIEEIRTLVHEGKLSAGTEEFYTQLEKKGCSFIMIDIDHFKEINDVYGHPAGDEILKQVAKTIASGRGADIVTRYGGEEFCVILPDTSPSKAHQVAEQLREKIEQTAYKFGKSSKTISISISMGVVGLSQLPSWKSTLSHLMQIEHHDDDVNREQLRKNEEKLVTEGIEEADKALYIAKRTGRNKVEMWNSNTDLLFQSLIQSKK
jgi:diguanylate cyclase (GGDEF)-like protein